MKVIHSIVFTVLVMLMVGVFQLQNAMMTPVRLLNPIVKVDRTLLQLNTIGIKSKEMALSIDMVSQKTKLPQEFIIALMYTESTGNKFAVSCKGYKGLMQIPHNVFYEDANLLIGARIFLEKMQQANHNMEKAICLYKGYAIGSERGKQQAQKVLSLYYRLKKEEV